MIDITQLKDENIGNWVKYKDSAGLSELGKLKSWNNTSGLIFVVFRCDGQWDKFADFTGVPTNPQDLTFK